VLDYPLLLTYAMIFNLRRPPFDRIESRRFVAAAVDPRAVVDGVLFGFGTPADGPLPPELARPAGPEPASPSAPEPGSGSALRFEMLTVGSGEAPLEQMLQAQLAALGARADIRQLELSTFLDRVQGPAREFDAAVMGIPGDLGLGHLVPLATTAGLRPDGTGERLVTLLQDSVAAVFLYHARGVQGMNRRVRGVTMDLRGELVTLAEWWVDDGEQ
jgi:peptide/nickel transport system substrate-binding protein